LNRSVSFLSFWVANAVLLLIASSILSSNVVLGTNVVSKPLASVFVGLVLTTLFFVTPPLVEKLGFKKNLTTIKVGDFKLKGENTWLAVFLAVNVVGIWVIKRLANVTGLGISGLFYVLILAILVTLVEWGVSKATGTLLKK